MVQENHTCHCLPNLSLPKCVNRLLSEASIDCTIQKHFQKSQERWGRGEEHETMNTACKPTHPSYSYAYIPAKNSHHYQHFISQKRKEKRWKLYLFKSKQALLCLSSVLMHREVTNARVTNAGLPPPGSSSFLNCDLSFFVLT